MSIEYELSLNKLTTPPSYAPRVRPRATTDLAALDGIGIVTTSVRAKVPAITDPLPADASIEIGFRANRDLRDQIQTQAHIERVEPGDHAPLLLRLAQTGPGVGGLGAGNVLQFIGARMKFDPAAPDEGVFFLSPSLATIRAANKLSIGDKKLQFAVPAGLQTDTTTSSKSARCGRAASPCAPPP